MTSSVSFIIPHSSFSTAFRRRSQVVRQRSAKPLFVGSIPTAAFFRINKLRAAKRLPVMFYVPVVGRRGEGFKNIASFIYGRLTTNQLPFSPPFLHDYYPIRYKG